MKKVFSSNSQLCHVWAQQKQSEGRASNMFFEDAKIYSYGTHYLAAQIHTGLNGKPFALVNSNNYSTSTSKHMGHIRSSLRGLMPYFSVSDVSSPKKALKDLVTGIQNTISYYSKRLKVIDQQSIDWSLERIIGSYDELNHLRLIMQLDPVHPDKDQLTKVRIHLESRLARYKELNSPEMIAKKKEDKNKREIANQKKLEEKLSESIVAFRQNGIIRPDLSSLPCELLRIERVLVAAYDGIGVTNKSIVRTSRGAEVPLTDAKKALELVLKGLDSNGLKVGHFQIESIQKLQDDQIIKIGCHRIKLSEAKSVLLGKAE